MSKQPQQATRERVLALLEQELEGSLDQTSRAWLEANRQAFPDLDEALLAVDGEGPLWQALGTPPASTAPDDLGVRGPIEAHLAGEPVAALPLENPLRWRLLGLGVAVVALVLLALGIRKDYDEQPFHLLALPAGLLVAGFAVALVSFDRLRQRGHRALAMAVLLAVPGLFLGVALTIQMMPHSHIAPAFIGPAVGCGALGLVVGLSVLVPAVVLARRGMAGPSQLGALLLGVTAAAVGVGTLHLRCSLVDVPHVLVGHGLLFLLLPCAALLLRRARRLA